MKRKSTSGLKIILWFSITMAVGFSLVVIPAEIYHESKRAKLDSLKVKSHNHPLLQTKKFK